MNTENKLFTLILLWFLLSDSLVSPNMALISFYLSLLLRLGLIAYATWLYTPDRYLNVLFGGVGLMVLIHPPQTMVMLLGLIRLATALAIFIIFIHPSTNKHPEYRRVSKGVCFFCKQSLSDTLKIIGYFYFPFTLLGFGNSNVLAMNIWAIFFLNTKRKPLWTLLAVVAMVGTGSEGGMLAMGLGWMVQRWGRWSLLSLIPALAGVIFLKGSTLNSVSDRVEMLLFAWTGFTQSPWVGHGLGYFQMTTTKGIEFYQPHNLILEIAYSWGGVGLIGLFLLAMGLYKAKNAITWQSGFLTAFFVHSLIDNPHWGLPGLLGAVVLATIYKQSSWISRNSQLFIYNSITIGENKP